MNVDRPRGFTPVGTLSGSPWSESVEAIQFGVAHAGVGVGDLIEMTALGYPDLLTVGATDSGVFGVIVGFSPQGEGWNITSGKFGDNAMSNTEPVLVGAGTRSLAANTEGTALVCTAPDVIMVGQEDGAGNSLDLGDRGLNVDITSPGFSTTTGNSLMEIASVTAATTATLPLRLLDLYTTPENELGGLNPATPWTDWKVTFANHARSGLAVGI